MTLPLAGLLGQAASLFTHGSALIQAASPDAAFVTGEVVRSDQVARGLRFLNAAYTAVWVILAAYLVLLSVRQRRLERQMQRLRQRLGIEGGSPDRTRTP